MLYPINEIFYSIQGEGYWTGSAAVFIRLAGCGLNCEWCDTDHTPKRHMAADEILEECDQWWINASHLPPKPILVITGGEPTKFNLQPLVSHAARAGWYVCIETNGTNMFKIPLETDWITCSPKPGVHYHKMDLAPVDELKVIYHPVDITTDPKYFKDLFSHRHRFIQPLHKPGILTNFDGVIQFVKENPEWRLSIQTHKILNIK